MLERYKYEEVSQANLSLLIELHRCAKNGDFSTFKKVWDALILLDLADEIDLAKVLNEATAAIEDRKFLPSLVSVFPPLLTSIIRGGSAEIIDFVLSYSTEVDINACYPIKLKYNTKANSMDRFSDDNFLIIPEAIKKLQLVFQWEDVPEIPKRIPAVSYFTPLSLAIVAKNKGLVERLIEKKAILWREEQDFLYSPFYEAISMDYNAGHDQWTEILSTALANDEKNSFFNYFLEKGLTLVSNENSLKAQWACAYFISQGMLIPEKFLEQEIVKSVLERIERSVSGDQKRGLSDTKTVVFNRGTSFTRCKKEAAKEVSQVILDLKTQHETASTVDKKTKCVGPCTFFYSQVIFVSVPSLKEGLLKLTI